MIALQSLETFLLQQVDRLYYPCPFYKRFIGRDRYCHRKAKEKVFTHVQLSPARDQELGSCCTTADILARSFRSTKQQATVDEGDGVYYPVARDSSLRIGESNGIEGASMEQWFDPSALVDGTSPSGAMTSDNPLRSQSGTKYHC